MKVEKREHKEDKGWHKKGMEQRKEERKDKRNKKKQNRREKGRRMSLANRPISKNVFEIET